MTMTSKDNCKALERTSSKDDLSRLFAGTTWGKIREALEKVLATEPGYCKRFTLPSAADKENCALPCAVYTIESFCLAHRISRAQLYVLLRRGEGPTTYTIGRRRYISFDAAAAWIRRNEAVTVAPSTRGVQQ
jgi:hypothetical protein